MHRCVVLAAAGAVLLAACQTAQADEVSAPDESTTVVVTTLQPFDAVSSKLDVGDLPFALPNALPAGASFRSPMIDTQSSGDRTAIYAGDQIVGVVVVGDPAAPATDQSITVDGIVRHLAHDGDGIRAVSWHDASTEVSLDLAQPASEDVVRDLVHRMTLDRHHRLVFTSGDGYTAVHAGTLVPGWKVDMSTGGRELTLSAVAADPENLTALLAISQVFDRQLTVTPSNVRGLPAMLAANGEHQTALMWWERGAVFIVESHDADESTLRDVAQQLEPVARDRWAAAVQLGS